MSLKFKLTSQQRLRVTLRQVLNARSEDELALLGVDLLFRAAGLLQGNQRAAAKRPVKASALRDALDVCRLEIGPLEREQDFDNFQRRMNHVSVFRAFAEFLSGSAGILARRCGFGFRVSSFEFVHHRNNPQIYADGADSE